MKTLKQLIKQSPVFLHLFKDRIDVIAQFENIYLSSAEYSAKESPYPNVQVWLESKAEMDVAIKRYEGIKILFASYGQDNYSGDAWILFEQDGKLYEVNGSHCSCYGLEDQWTPEEVVLIELEQRLNADSFGKDSYSDNEFANELKTFLGIS